MKALGNELGYIILGIILLAVLIWLSFIIIKNPKKLDYRLKVALGSFSILTYILCLFELISCSNINNYFVQLIMPYKLIPLIILICSLIYIVPDKWKIKRTLEYFVILGSVVLFYGLVSTFIEFYGKTSYTKEVWFLYSLDHIFVILYGISIVTKIVKKKNA